jgi:glycosyltransferase involved in cell wall biosynthesis
MTRVLIDARIRGADGIGRYTASLTRALADISGPGVRVSVLAPTGVPRYSLAESTELARAATGARADVIHTLDFRIPIGPLPVPVIATVHDVLRLDPHHCYTNEQFAQRYGEGWLAGLQHAVRHLREQTGTGPVPPEGTSLYAEYYARMLSWTCQQAAHIVTPSETVARQLAARLPLGARPKAIPLGIDHLASETDGQAALPILPERYLLYVGQARAHKGLPDLITAYQQSKAGPSGVPLVCVGRDFTPGSDPAVWVESDLGRDAVTLGEVPDGVLGRLYAQATALVHLATHEGFGLPPLEAMARGARIVASDIPVLRETLGQHAEFVRPDSPRDAASAIDKILATPDDSDARDARLRWARSYTWHRHAAGIQRLYKEFQPG